ncbi:MAG: helix-turn-helix domain-containing protein [Phycisphaera sp.]|nr:MAG: helix-turn-helix domain-containing protein [Phycisphaera sp.]
MTQEKDREYDGEDLLLEPWEAAKALRVSTSQLEKWTSNDLVPSVKLGRLRRYSPDILKAWIANGCPMESQESDEVGGE